MNFLNNLMTNFYALDINSGLEQAKNEVVDKIKFLVNNIAIPIIATVLVGILIFNIAKAVKKHRTGEGYGENITGIVITVLVLALVVSAPAWIWQMIA